MLSSPPRRPRWPPAAPTRLSPSSSLLGISLSLSLALSLGLSLGLSLSLSLSLGLSLGLSLSFSLGRRAAAPKTRASMP